jgi:hypothetical protein
VCLIQPENVPELKAASGWTKFQRRYGVEMSVKVPGNKIEADVVNNNYDQGLFSTENKITENQ